MPGEPPVSRTKIADLVSAIFVRIISMDQKLRGLLERTLKATTPLAEMGTENHSTFLNVLLGIYRVSFSTLRDIYYLSQNEESGASALDLARKIMEYGISVEYMIWKGKDEKAQQFQQFMAVELHRSLEFLKSIGQDVIQQDDETLKSGAEDYEKEYVSLKKEVRERKSWAGLSVDQMLKQLHTADQFKDFDFSRIGEAYIWGSRLNHVSPVVVRNLMGSEETRVASAFYMRQAITFALIFHFRLSTRYIDEMRFLSGQNVHQELADAVVSLRDEFNALQLEDRVTLK